MDIELIEKFLFWCLLINIGIYSITAIAALVFRGIVCRIHKTLFGMEQAAVMESIQNYLASYKLLITFFNFVPWVAVLIIRWFKMRRPAIDLCL